MYLERLRDVTLALVYDGSRLLGLLQDQTPMGDETHDWCLTEVGEVFPQVQKMQMDVAPL